MIHNIHLIQRRLQGKSNAGLLPLVIASAISIAIGLMLLFLK